MAADGTAGRRLRILYLSPRHPVPTWRGDQVRVYNLVRALSRHADVSLLSFGPAEAEPVEGVESRTVSFSDRRPSARQPGLAVASAARAGAPLPRPRHAAGRRRGGREPAARTWSTRRWRGWRRTWLRRAGPTAIWTWSTRSRSTWPDGPGRAVRLNRAAFEFEARLMDRYEQRVRSPPRIPASAVSEADRRRRRASAGDRGPKRRRALGVSRSPIPPTGRRR